MFNFSLNNMIDVSAGVTIMTLSLSGLMCKRSRNSNSSCNESSSNTSDSSNQGCVSRNNRTSCSMSNFNLGASAAGVTGALLLYRGINH